MSAHEMTTASMITCVGCKHSYAETALYCPSCGTPKAREFAANDSLLGKILGERFLVQEQIGQGASGTIYRAEHVTLRRRVAIKVLHDELSRDDLAVERFRREATTVAEIDNEHIVEIHDFGRTPDGRLYLAMELLEGETLDAVLAREKQLSVERTADILIQVGEALMEAHAIGYVHRDMRPRNLFLSMRRGKTNFVKLLDFGLAKLVETDASAASTSLGMTFGDPRYMSPEQARGDRIDRRADIYQLGCVAYEMLTGMPPFSGNRVFDILSKQVTEIPAPLPTQRTGIPLWMEAAVTKMLAKDPDNRFATTTRMVEALRRGLETGEVMEDEVARRRESIPPPSVSRVMQRMGIPAPIDTPLTPGETLKGHLEGPLPAQVPAMLAQAQQVMDKHTIKGNIEGPLPPAVRDPLAAAVAAAPVVPEPRRRTGTPQVGVPEVPVAAASQAPVAGQIVTQPKSPSGPVDALPAGRVKASDVADSASWFEDEADERRVSSPSVTDLSYLDEAPATNRRWPLIFGALVVTALIGGAIAFAVTRTDDETQTAQNTVTPPPPAPTPAPPPPPSEIIAPAGSAAPVGSAAPIVAPPPAPAPAPAPAPPVIATKAAPKETKVASTKSAPAPKNIKLNPGTKVDVEASGRRPSGGGFFGNTPTPTPPTPTPPTPANPTGVSGGPEDPYGTGGGEAGPPAEGSPDKKAEFYANVGQQQLSGGDAVGAATNFKKALELDAKNVHAIIGMGEVALRQGLFGDAMAHLKKAAKLAPKSSRVFTLLGEAYLNSGNHSAAADNFKKALQLDPDNARAREGFNEASSKVPPPSE